MGLEGVLAVKDVEGFGTCALGSEEDGGGKMHRCRSRGCQLVGIPSDDGCLVREEQSENLVSDLSWELEKEERHW